MIKNLLKKLSVIFQTRNTSVERHHHEMITGEPLLREKEIALNYIQSDEINSPQLRIDTILKANPTVKIAIDIGSGAGWASAALTKRVDKVIAIEPSQAGIDLAKNIFPPAENPSIEWHHGFAEEILNTLTLDTPTLFMTGCVLSHLRDKEVLAICNAITKIAPTGSALAFSEAWADTEWHQIMWHVRSKDWWQKALPGWELDFHGPKAEDYKKCHMGFWGVKK